LTSKAERITYSFNALRRDVMLALCQTKLSGADFRAVLLILNQTDGYNRSEDKIKPTFFEEKAGLDKDNQRRTISRLKKWNMVAKSGFYYMVLPPAQWDKDVFLAPKKRVISDTALELAMAEHRVQTDTELPSQEPPSDTALELAMAEHRVQTDTELPSQEPPKRVQIDTELPSPGEKRVQIDTVGVSELTRPPVQIDTVLASSTENLSTENLSTENSSSKKKKKGAKAPDGLVATTPASKYLFEKTGRKRWGNLVQKEEFEKAEALVGEARMRSAIDWALLSGISNIKSIITAAKGGRRAGAESKASSEAGRPGAHRGDPLAATRAAGWEVEGDDEPK